MLLPVHEGLNPCDVFTCMDSNNMQNVKYNYDLKYWLFIVTQLKKAFKVPNLLMIVEDYEIVINNRKQQKTRF